MSPRTMHVTIDPTAISPAKALAAAARSGLLVIVTDRAFRDLADEFGGVEATWRHVQRVANRSNRPVGANLLTADGSRTCFVAPKGWTQERLRGWVAGHHEAIEAAFGPAMAMPEDAA